MKFMAIFAVRVVSMFFKALGMRACRFSPTCSVYAAEAFETYGFRAGLRLSITRVLRCQPFSRGGFDPVLKPAGR